jgi:hypothetical protein
MTDLTGYDPMGLRNRAYRYARELYALAQQIGDDALCHHAATTLTSMAGLYWAAVERLSGEYPEVVGRPSDEWKNCTFDRLLEATDRSAGWWPS